MRKNVFFGLLVILLAFCLTVVGCDNGSTNRNRDSNGNETTTYTVTFNSNGGSSVQAITGITSGSTITQPENPSRTGFEAFFVGWFKEEGLINIWNFSSDVVTADITLYAQWRPFEIGENGPGGGIIFYRREAGFIMTDDNTTAHYLEAAPQDMPEQLTWVSPERMPDLPPNDPEMWNNDNWVGVDGTESAIGTGRKNTALILAFDPLAPAAKACHEYTNNGKSDWFLPSHHELFEFYKIIDTEIYGTEYYSHNSSTQGWPNSIAIMQRGFHDSLGGGGIKWSPRYVRAVRAF